jgi:hypothetical protein
VRFDEFEEQARWQQSILRMLPANERFGAQHLRGGEIDLGLIDQAKLLALESKINVRWVQSERPVAHERVLPLVMRTMCPLIAVSP